jgi:hypothetical protein
MGLCFYLLADVVCFHSSHDFISLDSLQLFANENNKIIILLRSHVGFQGGILIPQSYTRSGVGLFEVDLVVFVTTRPVLTPHVLAFAGECQEDQ